MILKGKLMHVNVGTPCSKTLLLLFVFMAKLTDALRAVWVCL
jgi:hypothetical protein